MKEATETGRSLCEFLTAGAVLACAGLAAAAPIQWVADAEGPAAFVLPVQETIESLLPEQGFKRIAVTFASPLSAGDRQDVEAAGVKLLAPLGPTSYFMRLSPESDLEALEQAIGVVSTQTLTPRLKTHRDYRARTAPEWTVAPPEADAGDGAPVDQRFVGLVQFHTDINLADAVDAITAAGGQAHSTTDSINAVTAMLTWDALDALATDDRVQWMEPLLPALAPTNADTRNAMGVNVVRDAPYGLDGSGVRVMVYDGGVGRASHLDFGSRFTVRDASGLSNHATHVAGTVGGSGAASGGRHQGMAPAAIIDSWGFEWNGPSTFFVADPGDIEADYTAAFVGVGTDLSNNSIGANIEPNGLPCALQGDYGAASATIDAILNGSLGVTVRTVWAAGNERGGSSCDVEGVGDYRSLAPPAGAKNTIVVGAINAEDNSMTGFSSWGPTDDGRLKPDVVAPGCKVVGSIVSPGSSGDNRYSSLCGTSMASPAVAGVSALVLQDYRRRFPSAPELRNSSLKAYLIHSAQDLGNLGPDYVFGYGAVDAPAAIDLLRADSLIEGVAEVRAPVERVITVLPGDAEFRATLAWDDLAATPNAARAMINDLDLVVIAPDGTRYYPWTLDPAVPSADATQDTVDRLNNVEQVLVGSPMPGEWTVRVEAFATPGGAQRFSLVTSPAPFQQRVSMNLVGEAPAEIPAGDGNSFDLAVGVLNDSVAPGSAKLFYRLSPAAGFQSRDLTPVDASTVRATLPLVECADEVEFYFQIAGEASGTLRVPESGTFAPIVGAIRVSVEDNLETDQGWTVGAPDDDAVSGVWQRADPQGTAAQPENDASIDNDLCWVTGAAAGSGLGSNDIDSGKTTLTSPRYDLSGMNEAFLGYARWYSNTTGQAPNADVFVVEVSQDDGVSWASLETVGPAGPGTSGGWVDVSYPIHEVIELTDQFRVRFIASDEGAGSLVEAAIDDIRITFRECEDQATFCSADFDSNGIVDLDDFSIFASQFGGTDCGVRTCSADLDSNGTVDLDDFAAFAGQFGQTVCD